MTLKIYPTNENKFPFDIKESSEYQSSSSEKRYTQNLLRIYRMNGTNCHEPNII